jgi:hypothetical protein
VYCHAVGKPRTQHYVAGKLCLWCLLLLSISKFCGF